MLGQHPAYKLLELICGNQVVDRCVFRHGIVPRQIAAHKSAKSSRCTHQAGEARSDLNFISLARSQKSETRRVGFHQSGNKIRLWYSQLRERPGCFPKGSGLSIFSPPQEEGEFRPELLVRQPHANIRSRLPQDSPLSIRTQQLSFAVWPASSAHPLQCSPALQGSGRAGLSRRKCGE